MHSIRPLTNTDIPTLVTVARESFWESFIEQNDPAVMRDYCDATFSSKRFTDEIQRPNSRFFGVECAGHLIGYMKVNVRDAQTESCLDNAFEIERIYVLQPHQGKGYGKALFHHAKTLAETEGYTTLWLGVWEHNAPSIAFYERQGLTQFSSHPFYLGEEKQTDLLMKMALEPSEKMKAAG